MEAEMDEHLGYKNYKRSDNSNSRNGAKEKKVRSKYGELPLNVAKVKFAMIINYYLDNSLTL